MTLDARDPVALASALVRCPSVTPQEGGALGLLAGILAEAGFDTHPVRFSDHDTPDVDNLWARIGPPGPALVFAGHTDVVPPGHAGAWTRDPFSGAVEDGFLHGRGAADMKGAVAASVSAALRHLDRHGPSVPLAFLLTGDEEGPAINGTVKLLDWAAARGERLGACLLGEPTNPEVLGSMVKVGRRGSLSGTITVEGVQGHVAYPHRARNPIRMMVRLLDALLAEPPDHGTPWFEPSNLEPVSVDVGNGAFNVIPGVATARFNIRYNDSFDRQALEAWVQARLDTAGEPYRVEFGRTHSEAFRTEPGPFVDGLVEAIRAETGRRPELSTSGGTSDARFVKDYCPVVEFGLVGATMHAVNERVATADIEALTRIYGRVIEAWRPEPPSR